MSYKILAPEQFEIADQVKKYLSGTMGLSKIKVEESIDASLDYRPTFTAQSQDHHLICVDVSEALVNSTRANFISQCERQGRAVKFYVAIASTNYTDFAKDFKEAKRTGIGIIEVNLLTNTYEILNQPLSLSLTGLRPFQMPDFPKKYRQTIMTAIELFKSGEPNKACSLIYDELESLTRKLAIKSYNAGEWSTTLTNPGHLKDRMAWASVIKHLRDDLNRSGKYKVVTEAMMSRLHGVTTYRNDSGHKSNDTKALQKRDNQLRTRMESAIDLLHELATISNQL